MKTPNNNAEDLRQYRTLGLTLLQLMGVLALIGIVLECVMHYFF